MSKNIAIFLALSALLGFFNANAEIVNTNVERTLDLTSQLVKTTTRISAEDAAGKAIAEYVFFVAEPSLAYIAVKDSADKNVQVRKNDEQSFTFTFPKASAKQTFVVETVSSKGILPHPEEIRQNDKQFVRYIGNLHLYSKYKTNAQKATVKLSSSNILSHTQVKPYSVSANKITLGSYENVEALSQEPLVIHYENSSPFVTVNTLERTLEISHWGNIAVQEAIQMTHTGAKLKGSFSRYDFQKEGRSGQSALKSYKTYLPASASGVYYRDTNGNISTSNMNSGRDFIELELRPRFPLFGGWKTQYTLGYNVPSYEYMFSDGNKYQLKMHLIDHIYDNMAIDEATIKIILPEGCSDIKLSPPYSVSRLPNELVHTYLDTTGRPVISFTKSNLVESHISDFTLYYSFSKISLLQEPLLVSGFIYIIFVITIVFLRLDFSITSHSHKD
ncbi:dolichyl-diphosphooligosaccharide--protein glycosyltransferase subunit 1 [Drosophila kikkawai]|uniref:Dolichyl-diphosphooligosaccharide--protein glycosyltransferase subunit 1 n=1 Tax=Drosophila kikkawai TaxID=30033 RepID=A0A6P4ITZ3_DROKI|nr:dolichyl-diphosphooligosaccharide--protein glycosyltransferase subunit 1 [Drosophila kikkawai]